MGNSMSSIIQNIGNIVVSDRKLGLFNDFQMALALFKWPWIDLNFCMVVSRSVIFKIHLIRIGDTSLHGDPIVLGEFFAEGFFVGKFFAGEIFARIISPEHSSLGTFFAGSVFA
jgi:hypothetical protein